ncbi:MAG: glycosyltransferase family 1 protein [Bacteroidota bacterium]|nr:glycosyltransferase family 1 protein [Bacteroidota bacterium]
MRIGFDAKRIFNNQTGLGNYSRSLVKGLLKAYPENQFDLYTPEIKIFKDFLLAEPNVKRFLPDSILSKTFPGLWRNQWMLRDLIKNKTQIYHGLSNELPVGIEHSGIKSVVSIHDLIFLHEPQNYSWIDRQIYQRKFKSAVSRADIVIAASQQTKRDIIHFYGTDPNKIEVIYQDCDPAFAEIYSDEVKAAVTKKYMLPGQFILSVGTLEKRKNHLYLLKAFHQDKLEKIHLVLIGKKGDAYHEIIDFINSNHLQKRVTLINQVDYTDLPCLFQLAYVFVYPSLLEGFGIPVLEALKSRVPVITSNCSSLPEVAGNAAILVDPTNINEIKDALEKACFNNSLRDQLIANTGNQIKKFDGKELATELMEVYKKLV